MNSTRYTSLLSAQACLALAHLALARLALTLLTLARLALVCLALAHWPGPLGPIPFVPDLGPFPFRDQFQKLYALLESVSMPTSMYM